MYEFTPMTDRVKTIRERYRSTVPTVCLGRYKIITEFYMNNRSLTGILKRAKAFKAICEGVPVRISEGEVIVGAQGGEFRSSAIYPETGFGWIANELDTIGNRHVDPYIIRDEDKEYIRQTAEFWFSEAHSSKADAYVPDYLRKHEGNGVTTFRSQGGHMAPVGHFTADHAKAINVGFAAIRDEAESKVQALEAAAIPGTSINEYNFYRAIVIVCDGMITLTKRYQAEAQRLYEACTDETRKAELAMMVDTLGRVMEKPCESFVDALQCIYMYQTCLALDANLHGMSFGRLDQYLYPFYKKDIESGKLTPEYAQELIDLFYLKIAEVNRVCSIFLAEANPGYNSGQLVTLGGVDKDGNDASNPVTYMMLQASGHMKMHSPPQALRVHKNTPPELWEAALYTTSKVGGMPSLENDEVIIPALMSRGHTLESARNYCLIGCVEPSGCGNEWPACGGVGSDSYVNLANALYLGINDGFNGMPSKSGPPKPYRLGLPTGYLKDMKSIEEVKEAYRKQMDFFVSLHAACINSYEYTTREAMPLPVASATIKGCMESGKDVMFGGAEYNSTGLTGIGLGNVADSLQMIEHLVFDKKICTAAELQDALEKNWEGYDELYEYIQTKAPHYGNGDENADKYVRFVTETFADTVRRLTGPRGNHYAPGMYPVTTNVTFGKQTPATADGRKLGQPLADGISPRQGMDVSGPTALLRSVLHFDNQDVYSNGTLLNLKFDPNTVKTETDLKKMAQLVSTYFANGGMEVQINVVDAKTLRAANENPAEYRDLVVRVAGFSAYFVDLATEGRLDLISRTELGL